MGALTSKPYAFRARPWELESNYNFWFYDSILFNIRVDILNLKIERLLPRINYELNLSFIPDTVRFFITTTKKLSKIIFPFFNIKKQTKDYFIKIIWPFYYYIKFNYLMTNNLLLKKINIFEILSNNLDILDIINLKTKKMIYGNYKKTAINLLNNFSKFYNFYFLNYFNIKINKTLQVEKKYKFYFFNFNARLESPVLNLFLKRVNKKLKSIEYHFNNFLFNKKKNLNFEINLKGLFKIKRGQSLLNLFLSEKNKIHLFFINEHSNNIITNFTKKIVNTIYTLNNFYNFLKITKIILKYKDIYNTLSILKNKQLDILNIYNLDIFKKLIYFNIINKNSDIISQFLLLGINIKTILQKTDFLLPTSYFFERCFFSISIFNKPIFTKKIIENLITNLDTLDIFYYFHKKKKKKLVQVKKQINKTFYLNALYFFNDNKVSKQKEYIKKIQIFFNYINDYTILCNTIYHKSIKNELQTFIEKLYV